MSGAGYSKAPDLTGVRRNPGLGMAYAWSCAKCNTVHTQAAAITKRRFGSSWLVLCKGGCK